MTAPKALVAGNWKMNGLKASGAELERLIEKLGAVPADCDVMICPPATLIARFAADAAGSAVAIGAQDCHTAENGAHTGDLSAPILADAGASAIIVGHSERRADHGETSALVAEKAKAAWAAGLVAIICVGETEAERDAGNALKVVTEQLSGSVPEGATPANTVVAYEPVWAIGTGRTPTPEDVAEMHDGMRAHLKGQLGEGADGIRLLYGGSVKPANAAELMAVSNVNGALVGGASLKADDFDGIIAVYR